MSDDEPDIAWRSDCPISSGLDLLGDRWSLLIIRDLVVHRTRTYSEFLASPEGISTNILAARLILLTALGLIERTRPDGPARGNGYALTPRGAALKPTLVEFLDWARVHLSDLHPGIHEEPRIR